MSLREKINENPQLASGVGGGIAVLAIAFMLYSLFGGGDSIPSVNLADAQLYFSTDEGVTFAPGPAANRLTPGVVQAHVFTLDDGKTQIVGYVERWTAEAVAAQKDLEKAIKSNNGTETTRLTNVIAANREVRKPKVGGWVKSNAPEATKIMAPTGPKGEDDLTEVYPPPKK